MNFDDLKQAWTSPDNGGNAADLISMKTKLNAALRKRRQHLAIFLSLVTLGLTGLTVTIAWNLGRADALGQSIDPSREWAAFLALALPWAAAIFFVTRFVRHCREHGHYERTIQESLQASLDQNRFARQRVKTIAWLHGLLLLVVPLVVLQLRAVGKAGDEILVPAFVIWPLISLSIGGSLLYHYRTKLLPEKRELEGLLGQYEEAAENA